MLERFPRIALRSILGYFRRVPPGREVEFDRLATGKGPVPTTEFIHAIALRPHWVDRDMSRAARRLMVATASVETSHRQ